MEDGIKLLISVGEKEGDQIQVTARHIYKGELKILSQCFLNDGSDDTRERAQFIVDYVAAQAALLVQESLDDYVNEKITPKEER